MGWFEHTTETSTVVMGRVGERPLWVLTFSLFVRAAHQVGAAVFLASYLMGEIIVPSPFYFWLAVISGCMLLLTEGMRHRQIYREVAGLSTLVKIILFGAAIHGLLPQTITILAAFVLASIGAHAPKIVRHRLVF